MPVVEEKVPSRSILGPKGVGLEMAHGKLVPFLL
jgi:hypothetical protein